VGQERTSNARARNTRAASGARPAHGEAAALAEELSAIEREERSRRPARERRASRRGGSRALLARRRTLAASELGGGKANSPTSSRARAGEERQGSIARELASLIRSGWRRRSPSPRGRGDRGSGSAIGCSRASGDIPARSISHPCGDELEEAQRLHAQLRDGVAAARSRARDPRGPRRHDEALAGCTAHSS